MKIMKFLEFNKRITKIMQKKMILRQNHEHHEILRIPCQNNENHQIHKIPFHNQKKLENNYSYPESRKS